MSIGDMTGQGASITDPNRALEFFANRSSLIRHFATYLNGDPACNRILFFHGEGGNGKTLLLRYLYEHCCKRLVNLDWLKARDLDDDSFRDFVKGCNVFDRVPKARLDFSAQPTVERNPKDPFSGLLMLRGQLAHANIPFPLFDFACTWYMHQTKRLTMERLQQLIPTEGLTIFLAVAKALVDPGSLVDLAQVLLDSVDRHFQGRFSLYAQKRKLCRSAVEMVLRMDPDKDLINHLPVLFAEDLNASMQMPEMPRRVALLFDAHDALWRREGGGAHQAHDTWLRTLLVNLNLSDGIVVALSGREAPRWARDEEPEPPFIPGEFIDTQYVGCLKSIDAIRYLELAQIKDVGIQQQLLRLAQAAEDQIHPFLLGLLVDVYRLACASNLAFEPGVEFVQQRIEDKISTVIGRLLTYVSPEVKNGIRALSACRSFDRQLHRHLGASLDFGASREAFDALVGFSFVSRVSGEGDNARFRIHDLLRRLLRENGTELTRRADAVLEVYYRELVARAGTAATVEAIYHANRCDWERGAAEWVQSMEEGLTRSRYDLCSRLLDIRALLDVRGGWESIMSQLSGDYFLVSSRYGEAEREFRAAIAANGQALASTPEDPEIHHGYGNALLRLGDLQSALSHNTDAIETYRTAIAYYDRALQLAPGSAGAHSNRGIALHHMGRLQTRLALHDDALHSYLEASYSHNRALSLAPGEPTALSRKADTMQGLGELLVQISQHETALAVFAAAVSVYDQVVAASPDGVHRNNMGIALKSLGELQDRLAQYQDALASYTAAISVFDEALADAPNFTMAHNNKGQTLQVLGQLHARLSRHQDAIASYTAASAAFDQALTLSPNLVEVHHNKGDVLHSLGDLYDEVAQYDDALKSHTASINSYKAALALAPEDAQTQNNMAGAYSSLGMVYIHLSQHDAALESYRAAVKVFDQALAIAPQYVFALNNKGMVLRRLGDLQATLSQIESAITSYNAAIASIDQALALSPKYLNAFNNKGNALQSLGALQADQDRHQDAIASYNAAISTFDQCLAIAPRYVWANANKGNNLARIGRLQADLGQSESALASYLAAIKAYDQALTEAPNHGAICHNKGLALLELGDLETKLEQTDNALASYGAAVSDFDRALDSAPDSVQNHVYKGITLHRLADATAGLGRRSEALESYEGALIAYKQALVLSPTSVEARHGITAVERKINTLLSEG